MGLFDWIKSIGGTSEKQAPRVRILQEGHGFVVFDQGDGGPAMSVGTDAFDRMMAPQPERPPRQADLDAVLAGITRVRILGAGVARGKALLGHELADVRDPARLDELVAALRIDEPASRGTCTCSGAPALELFAGDRPAGVLGLQHGEAIRWHGWSHDAKLVDGAALTAWVQRCGVSATRLDALYHNRFDAAPDPGAAASDVALHAVQLAERALAAGDLDAAWAHANRALESVPGMAGALSVRAMVHGASGRYAEGEVDASAAIAARPDWFQPYLTRGRTHIDRGQLEAALQDFGRAVTLLVEGGGAEHPAIRHALLSAYTERARAAMALGLKENAEEDLDRAVRLDPDSPLARCSRGCFRADLGRHTEALEDLAVAVRESRGNPQPFIERGRTLLAMGRPEPAELDFTTALEMHPVAPVYRLRAETNARLARWDQALADVNRAVELAPEDPFGYLMRGRLLQVLRRFENSRSDLEAGLARRPDDPAALCYLAWLLAACPADAVRDGARAVELAGRAVAITHERNSGALEALAAAHAECGQFDEAVRRQRQALDLGVADAKASLARAEQFGRGEPFRN